MILKEQVFLDNIIILFKDLLMENLTDPLQRGLIHYSHMDFDSEFMSTVSYTINK